jgi:hypothetical protein
MLFSKGYKRITIKQKDEIIIVHGYDNSLFFNKSICLIHLKRRFLFKCFCWSLLGLMRMNTQRKVSCEGTPSATGSIQADTYADIAGSHYPSGFATGCRPLYRHSYSGQKDFHRCRLNSVRVRQVVHPGTHCCFDQLPLDNCPIVLQPSDHIQVLLLG